MRLLRRPTQMVFLRPNLSPQTKAKIAPKKAPSCNGVEYLHLVKGSLSLTAKQLETIPEILATLVSGNQYLKSAEMRTDEKTP
jgi:hypothetical protein